MTEQTRTRSREQTDPALDDFNDIWEPHETTGLVQVATGLYSERLPVAGMTVAAVRESFADRLDIDPQALAVLDGEAVNDESTTVRAGQQLAFVRFSGEKGCHGPWRTIG